LRNKTVLADLTRWPGSCIHHVVVGWETWGGANALFPTLGIYTVYVNPVLEMHFLWSFVDTDVVILHVLSPGDRNQQVYGTARFTATALPPGGLDKSQALCLGNVTVECGPLAKWRMC